MCFVSRYAGNSNQDEFGDLDNILQNLKFAEKDRKALTTDL